MISIRKISIVLVLGILSCHGGDKKKAVSYTNKDREIDKIRLKDLNDKSIDLERYKGKTIFINFWATWCKPCLEEMPSIEKAQNILRNEKVVFLLASVEGIEQIKEFSLNHDYTFNYVKAENSEQLNIQALPTTIIFNPKGDLVFSEMGSRNWSEPGNISILLKITKQND